MKSICIKTNNSHILDYLQKELNVIELNNICFTCNEFKNYKNIIVHYTGTDDEIFYDKISSLLSFFVIYEYEEDLFKDIIFKHYFYFSKIERNKILDVCFDIMLEENNYIKEKFDFLFKSFKNYIKNNKSIVLTGFINFRLHDYYNVLEKIADEAVNSYIIEKEYFEFISLLRVYINSGNSQSNIVHLIYSKNISVLLDEKKQIINMTDEKFNAKFLSDISFSKNDYTLNTLLTLLPKKIYIHLIDDYIDEFINTLKLIFEKRISYCHDCDICNIYKIPKTSLALKKE